MAADPQSSVMSVEDYLELDRKSLDAKYEYIDGHIFLMSGGTANHSRLSVNMIVALDAALRASPCVVYNSDMRVRIAATRYVYPDVSVSCDPADRGTIDIVRSPRVVVEVLSPGTEGYDRGRKASYYRQCDTIDEYVLIDAQRPQIEIYRRAGAFWNLFTAGPEDTIELASLRIVLPVATIYQGVELPPEIDNDEPQ